MLRVFQQCKTADGWAVIPIDSSSAPGVVYQVVVADWGDALCDCKGFNFNGYCKHIAKAREQRCRWQEGMQPAQNCEERKRRICPSCGSTTRLIAEED